MVKRALFLDRSHARARATGGLRRFLKSQNQTPVKLKAMVPVSLRERDRASELGLAGSPD